MPSQQFLEVLQQIIDERLTNKQFAQVAARKTGAAIGRGVASAEKGIVKRIGTGQIKGGGKSARPGFDYNPYKSSGSPGKSYKSYKAGTSPKARYYKSISKGSSSGHLPIHKQMKMQRRTSSDPDRVTPTSGGYTYRGSSNMPASAIKRRSDVETQRQKYQYPGKRNMGEQIERIFEDLEIILGK